MQKVKFKSKESGYDKVRESVLWGNKWSDSRCVMWVQMCTI